MLPLKLLEDKFSAIDLGKSIKEKIAARYHKLDTVWQDVYTETLYALIAGLSDNRFNTALHDNLVALDITDPMVSYVTAVRTAEDRHDMFNYYNRTVLKEVRKEFQRWGVEYESRYTGENDKQMTFDLTDQFNQISAIKLVDAEAFDSKAKVLVTIVIGDFWKSMMVSQQGFWLPFTAPVFKGVKVELRINPHRMYNPEIAIIGQLIIKDGIVNDGVDHMGFRQHGFVKNEFV